MEHDQRSVLKDINGQQNMNPLARDFSPMHKKASRPNQIICEDSDSSSSDDYRSAEEEEDEDFNKELDFMIRGMSSVSIMTPRAKKLKSQLQRSFSLNKTLDLNLSQQLIKEIENSKEQQKNKENLCMDVSSNASAFESDEIYESLLDQTESDSPVNTTIKLLKTPAQVNQHFLKKDVPELVNDRIVGNQTAVEETKNQFEECLNAAETPISVYQCDKDAAENNLNFLNNHSKQEEQINLPPEEITASNEIDSFGSINKSDDKENIDLSQNKEIINSALKDSEIITATLEENQNMEITEPDTPFEIIVQDSKIVSKLDGSTIIDENLPVAKSTLNTTFENAVQVPLSPKMAEEVKIDENVTSGLTKPILNMTFENAEQGSNVVSSKPSDENTFNTTIENVVQSSNIESTKVQTKIDNKLSETESVLNTTFDNIEEDIHVACPKPDLEMLIHNNFCSREPVLNVMLENIEQGCKMVSPKKGFELLIDNNVPKTEPVLNITVENIVSSNPDVELLIGNNSMQAEPLLNTTVDNVVHDCENLPPLSDVDQDIKIVQNLSETQPISETVLESFGQAAETTFTALKTDFEMKKDNSSEISDVHFKQPNVPAENVQMKSESLNKLDSIKTGLTEDFFTQSNILSGDVKNSEIVPVVYECSETLQENSEASQIIEEISDLNHTVVICDAAAGNKTEPDVMMINQLADPTIQETNQSEEISEHPMPCDITITHTELEHPPDVISNLDQTVTISDKSPSHELQVNNSIALSGRLSDIFKTDLAINNFANSTFVENRLNETLTIESTSPNSTITEIQPELNECDLVKKSNLIPNSNQIVTENIKPGTNLDLNTTVTYSSDLKAEKDITHTLNETYDFRNKSESKNINESSDKPEEFELTKIINTPSALDQTVIINDMVSHSDRGSSNANKMENISSAPESFDFLNNTNNFQAMHKMQTDFRDYVSTTKPNLDSTNIINFDQVEKIDSCKDLNQFKDNSELNGTFNVNRSQNKEAASKCNLSKNSLKLFDEFDSRSFSNEGSNVDLLCRTLEGVDLNTTHTVDAKTNFPTQQSEDLKHDKTSVLVKSETGITDKDVFDNSFMKFDESGCNLPNSNIPQLVVTNENITKDDSNNIIGSPVSANTLLLGSPMLQKPQASEKQNVERSESPKSTSIFKWIGQFLSPAKSATEGQNDNSKQLTDEQNNIKQDSIGQNRPSKNISKIENDFVSLGDETPLPDFMSVSTTSEPFNESRANTEEHIEYVNELIQLKQLINQNEDKLKKARDELANFRSENDKLQQSMQEHEKVLAKKVKNEKVIGITINNFERRVKELTIENEIAVRENKKKLQESKDERDSATNHLSSVESAFSNLHKKYEQCKTVIEQMKTNEEVLKSTNNNLRDILLEQKSVLDTLDDHFVNQFQKAEADVESHEKQHKVEMIKYTALIKKAELKKSSLEEALTKKQAENKELIELCDGLIQKVK